MTSRLMRLVISTWILTSLSSVPINANSQTLNPPEILLNPGDRAPNRGVLTPELRYRGYQTCFDDRQSCLDKIDQICPKVDSEEPPFMTSGNQWIALVIGLAAGLGIALSR